MGVRDHFPICWNFLMEFLLLEFCEGVFAVGVRGYVSMHWLLIRHTLLRIPAH